MSYPGSSFLGRLLYITMNSSATIRFHLNHIRSVKEVCCTKLEKYMRTNQQDTDNNPKPVTDILTVHCSTFVHVDNLLSRYLSWHLSENCKQYTVTHVSAKHFIFNCVVNFYGRLLVYQIVSNACYWKWITGIITVLYLNVLMCFYTSMCLHSPQWVGSTVYVTHVNDVFNNMLMYGVTITLNENFYKTVLLLSHFPCLDFSRFLR